MKAVFSSELIIEYVLQMTSMMNIQTKSYLFNFSYGKRTEEITFITEILNQFENAALTGITIFVNNNPYSLEFLLLLIFEKNDLDFDKWIEVNYPHKKMNYLINYTLDDIIDNQLNKKRYSAYSFSTVEQLKSVLTEEANNIFLFHSLKIIEDKWGKIERIFKHKIFLSHSSNDKPLVESIFRELQKEDIKVWFDKYEIDYGDSIADKLNEGLSNSDLGLICLSKNFLNSNWAKAEMNYFLQQRMRYGKKNFLILNIDLHPSEIPPLMQDYRYIDVNNQNWISELIDTIKQL